MAIFDFIVVLFETIWAKFENILLKLGIAKLEDESVK